MNFPSVQTFLVLTPTLTLLIRYPSLHITHLLFNEVEKQKCMQPECSVADLEIPDPNCPVTPFSDWSPCSVTCGKGVQIRTRLLLVEPEKEAECKGRKELNQQRQCAQRQDCVFDYETARQVCNQAPDTGSCRGVYQRYYYDPARQTCEEFEYSGCRGNQNNFLTREICMSSCSLIRASVPSGRDAERNPQQPITTAPRVQTQIDARSPVRDQNLPVDCVLSEFGEWSPCSVACGKKMKPVLILLPLPLLFMNLTRNRSLLSLSLVCRYRIFREDTSNPER